MSKEMVSVRLDLIAAKARQLAADYAAGRFWPGDLSRGLAELRDQITQVEQESRNDR